MSIAEWQTVRRESFNEPIERMKEATLRVAAQLLGGYQDTDWVDASAFSELNFLFNYTQGSLTSLEWKLYWSDDAETWYSVVGETVAPSTTTVTVQEYTTTVDEAFCWSVRVKGQFAKLQVKGTGDASGSSLAIAVTGRY